MLDVLTQTLEDSLLNEEIKTRLAGCLPYLSQAFATLGPVPNDELILAAASPRSAIILAVPGQWPATPATEATAKRKGEIALAVLNAIESSPSETGNTTITQGLALLLDPDSRQAQAADVARIAAHGARAVVVALLERSGPTETSLLCTVCALPKRTLH